MVEKPGEKTQPSASTAADAAVAFLSGVLILDGAGSLCLARMVNDAHVEPLAFGNALGFTVFFFLLLFILYRIRPEL